MTIFVLLIAIADLLFGGLIHVAFLASTAIVAGGPSVWLTVLLVALVGVVLAASVLHKAGDVA